MNISDETLLTLPVSGRDKLLTAIDERSSAVAAYRAASDAYQTAAADLARSSAFAAEKLAAPPGGHHHHPAAAVLAAAEFSRSQETREERIQAPVAAAQRRHASAATARDRALARQSEFAFVDNVITWLNRTARLGEAFAPAPKVSLGRVRDVAAEVSRVRREIETIDAQVAAVDAAYAPPEELRRAAFAAIDRVAASGTPRIDRTMRSGDPISLPRILRLGILDGNIVGDAGAPFLLWLVADLAKERIGQLIDAEGGRKSMSDDECDRVLANAAAQRLDLERKEEALIELAASDGRSFSRRRDVDPRAFLAIDV